MPSLGIALHPEGCTDHSTKPAPGVTSASGAMPTDVTFRRLEIGVQAIQLSPYHAGPAHASVPAPGPDRRFSGMRLSRSPFGSGLAIGPRNLPSSSSRLRRGYDKAPRGAMERIVIDVRQLLGQMDAATARALDVPHRGHRTADEDHEQPTADGVLGEIVLGDVMLAVSATAVNDWDVVRLGEASHAAAKATSQTHEVRVVKLFIGATHQRPPPHAKPAGGVAQRVVGVQDDPIDAVVRPVQQVGIPRAQLVTHQARLDEPAPVRGHSSRTVVPEGA